MFFQQHLRLSRADPCETTLPKECTPGQERTGDLQRVRLTSKPLDIYIYIYIYIYMYIYLHTYIYIYACVYTFIIMYQYTSMNIIEYLRDH